MGLENQSNKSLMTGVPKTQVTLRQNCIVVLGKELIHITKRKYETVIPSNIKKLVKVLEVEDLIEELPVFLKLRVTSFLLTKLAKKLGRGKV